MSWLAAAAVAAPIIGGLMGQESQADANEANIQQSREQMAFQERMSSTAQQRQQADMRLAGLNPILAAGGSGASSPGGSSAQITAENNMAQALQQSVSSAADQLRLQKDLEVAKEQTNLMRDQAEKITDERRSMELNNRILAEAGPARRAENSARVAEANLAKKTAIMDSDFQKYDGIKKRVDGILGSANSAANLVKPFAGPTGTDRVIDSKTGEILHENKGSRFRRR